LLLRLWICWLHGSSGTTVGSRWGRTISRSPYVVCMRITLPVVVPMIYIGFRVAVRAIPSNLLRSSIRVIRLDGFTRFAFPWIRFGLVGSSWVLLIL
jgi:hypothetical protein